MFSVEWDENSIQIEIAEETLRRVSAEGRLHYFDASGKESLETVVIAYNSDIQVFVASIGTRWAAMIGSFSEHPFVYCNEIVYDNSDGSSSQPNVIALPMTARKVDQVNGLLAFHVKWFNIHCQNTEH